MPDVGLSSPIVVRKALPNEQRVARVVLHGRLRKQFGREFKVGASNIANAIRVITILKPDFREALEEGAYKVVRGPIKGGYRVDERGLHLNLPPNGEFHLVPVAGGAKRGGGVGKIILGVVLVVAAFALPALGVGIAAAAGGAGTFGGLFTASSLFGLPVLSGLAMFGGAMVLGGVSSILSQTTSATQPGSTSAESFLLGGQLNTKAQGVAIPVVYGTEMMCGSVEVSIGYDTATLAIGGTPNQAFDNGDSGYSGGGGSGGDTTDPAALRSNATVRIIDVITEGPHGGFVNGPNSILFNGTPLRAVDGTWNFKGVSWELRRGLPDQPHVNGFPAAEQIVPVGIKVVRANPVNQTFHSETATGARVTINIPSLFNIDTKNGNQLVTNLQFNIEVRPSREADTGGFVGTYVTAHVENIWGRCSSPYEKSYHIDLPGREIGANVWDLRITRVTADSTLSTLQNDLMFELYTIITDHKMTYPDTAYVALTFDARSFAAGSVPARTYKIRGRTISIPANYDPATATYSASGPGTTGGTWDAVTFKPAPIGCSNPAWVLYDMISHERYGAGIALTALQITRADLYVIAQYCDGLVPDGFGAFERRYTVNAVISDRVEAYTMFQTMVSAFRGMTYWGAGQVQIVADMPKNPVKLVNQANVIDGNFTYQGTSLKTRHNMARVAWRNPDNYFRQEIEVFELTGEIARHGMVPADVIAFGCTSRSLARRLGKWLLYTENQQTEALQHDASLYQLSLRPGDIFQQGDPSYVGLRWAGRLRTGSTAGMLLLDSLLNLYDGNVFRVSVVMPDDTVAVAIFPRTNVGTSADGQYSIVYLDVAFGGILPQTPLPHAEWIILDETLDPRLFQAVSVAATAPGRYQVSSIAHNPTKFDQIELGIVFRPQIFSKLPALLLAALPPPSNVSAVDYLVGIGNSTVIRVTVSWTAANDPRVHHYDVQAKSNIFETIHQTTGQFYDFDGLDPGAYTFSVRSVDRNGATSAWVSAPLVLVDGLSDPPDKVLGLQAIGGTRRVMLQWLPGARRDLKYYEVQRAPAVGSAPGIPGNPSPNPGAPGSFAFISYVGATSWMDGASDTLIPNSIWWYRVRAVTTTDVVGTFSDPAWALTTMLIVDDLMDGIINTAKFAQSIKPVTLVSNLNTPGLQNDIVFNTTDSQLYKFNAGHWEPLIDLATIHGQLDDARINSLSASKLTGTLTSDQISGLAAAKISGQIVGSQIFAGAITAEKLSVAAASNLVWNSCLEQASDGWTFNVTPPLALVGAGTTKFIAGLDSQWRLSGFGTGYITPNAGLLGGQFMQAFWDPNLGDPGNPVGIAFPPNLAIEAQAKFITHRCAARVQIDFYNFGNAYISSLVGNRVTTPAPPDGQTLGRYVFSWAHGVSPANCARVRLSIVFFNDGGADIPPQTTAPFGFWTQSAIGASITNATEAQAWVPGGVTTITGPIIKTGTIETQQLRAGGIDADRLVARSITADKIQTLSISANELAANSVILGKVAAGAIRADQIAVNEIRATHLAADFQLTQSAQIGTAVIGTAQIGFLAVGTQNIASNAVTNLGAGTALNRVDLTVVSNGSPVILLMSGEMNIFANNILSGWQLYRDGALLRNVSNIPIYIDSPGNGSFFYSLINASPGDIMMYFIAMTVKK